ncbi:hypothetical protein [Candidatus Nitrosotenuis cloacae]|uniref:Uncharacterized protein n=1 Tax=Candidatus Nitrosotenuis cloacae TaxID=1603555 RepID=A0A3G1B265_9ARCH|nr:hypothetical protein [Candidatus Nitrosotenuis cloacae]AJZ76219.1 hypothetical protein SU86_007410 [Candidatus Nitrosotenuis cloacae]
MVDLLIQVFERYTLQDVLGEIPQADEKLRQNLEFTMSSLIKNLDNKSSPEMQKILSQHLRAKQEITKFSGAMALDQSKLELFHEFLTKYICEIESRLK